MDGYVWFIVEEILEGGFIVYDVMVGIYEPCEDISFVSYVYD